MNTAQLQHVMHIRYTTRAPYLALQAQQATAILNGSTTHTAQPSLPSFHHIVQTASAQQLHYAPATHLARIRRSY